MEQQRGLVPIPKHTRLWQAMGILSETGEWCHFVLFSGGLGWRKAPSGINLLSSHSSEYYLIPLESISEVELITAPFELFETLRFVRQVENTGDASFDIQIRCPQYWVTRIERLGIPVRGAERVDSKTVRGFVYNYGLIIWASLMFVTLAYTMLFSHASDITFSQIAVTTAIAITTLAVIQLVKWAI